MAKRLKALFMPPTLKKLEGHIAFGLSVCLSVCLSVRLLTFVNIPHEKIVDPYFFSCPSYAPFLSYVPLKTKFENLVCKISQKVFKLEPSYLVHLFGLRSR